MAVDKKIRQRIECVPFTLLKADGVIHMSTRSWKYLFTVATLAAATLYQSSFMNFGLNFCLSVVVLVLLSFAVLSFVQALANRFSSCQVLALFTSVVLGFGAAAFISVCSRELFLVSTDSIPLYTFFRFLLPLGCILFSFTGLQALPLFQIGNTSKTLLANPETASSSPKKFIPDISALDDGRIVDLARLGLFESQIIIPNFLLRELKIQAEHGDELIRSRARKCLETLRRLESLPRIGLQFKEVVLPETLDLSEKIVLFAKNEQAWILSNELSLKPDEQSQGLTLTLETIASALKPPIPKGENLAIKIQRLGKEPKQGIGYLDDGTMVVVNGGGDFLGKTVRTQVLSQKYSTSGKIVFCNVRDEDDERIHAGYSHIELGCCNTTIL
jgi:uncharacterized protein YacL